MKFRRVVSEQMISSGTHKVGTESVNLVYDDLLSNHSRLF